MSHLDEGTIHAWLDGALPIDESQAAEAHVAGCADCSRAVAEARGLIAAASRILTTLDGVPGGVIPQAGRAGGGDALDVAESDHLATRRSAKAEELKSARPRSRFSPRLAAAAALMFVAAGTYAVSRDSANVTMPQAAMSPKENATAAAAARVQPTLPAATAQGPPPSPATEVAADQAATAGSREARPPSAPERSTQSAVRAMVDLPAPPVQVDSLSQQQSRPGGALARSAPLGARMNELQSVQLAIAPAPADPRTPNGRQITPRRYGGGAASGRSRESEGFTAASSAASANAGARAKGSSEAPRRDRLEAVVTTGAASDSKRAADGTSSKVPSRTDDAITLLRYARCYRLDAMAARGDSLLAPVPAQVALDTTRVNPSEAEAPLYRVRLLGLTLHRTYDEVTWAPDTSAAGFELYWRIADVERGVVLAPRRAVYRGLLREWPMLSMTVPVVFITARPMACGDR